MADPTRYNFSPDYQEKLVALCVQDPMFLHRFAGSALKPEWFEVSSVGAAIRILIDYYKSYGRPPTETALVEEIGRHASRANLKPDYLNDILSVCSRAFSAKLDDREHLTDLTIEFARRQAFKIGVKEIVEMEIRGDDISRSPQILSDHISIGLSENEGSDLFTSLPGLTAEAQGSDFYSKAGAIRSIFLPSLDDALNGGFRRKEVWSIVGRAGFGKSMLLVNLGWAAIRQRIPVVHFSFGDLHDLDVRLRYASRLAGISMGRIVAGSTDYEVRAKAMVQGGNLPYLRTIYYPSGVATSETVRSHLSRIALGDGVKVGVVIVDYPGEMRRRNVESLYIGGEEVYSALDQIADDFNCLVLAGSQIAVSKLMFGRKLKRGEDVNPFDVLTEDMMDESSRKGQKVDGVITINQHPREYQSGNGLVRLWLDKSRRGRKQILLPCRAVFSSCFFSEIKLEEWRSRMEAAGT